MQPHNYSLKTFAMTSNSDVKKIMKIIDASYSPNHWADEVEPKLAVELEALSKESWSELTEKINESSSISRQNIARALRYTVTERSTDLLINILRSDDPLAALVAVKSLYDRYQFWLPNVSIQKEIKRHMTSVPPTIQIKFEALLSKALC